MTSNRSWRNAGLGLGLLAILPFGCVGQESASAAESKADVTPLVDAISVQVGPIATSVDATANLVAERQVAVVAEVDGRLVQLDVDEGDMVEAGQLIGVLDGRNAKHQIAAAKIKVSGAHSSHERADKLFRIAGGVSLREDLPLERLWRDSQSAIHHVQNVQDPIMQAYGLDFFGHPVPPSVKF